MAASSFVDAPLSYCGPAVGPQLLLAQWNFEPAILALLGVGAVGAIRLAKQGHHRESRIATQILLLLAFLYVSPFCAWGSSLFTVRVVHHLLLALVLAPLLALLGSDILKRCPGGMTGWTVIASAAMWAWHAPRLYDWAVASDLGYWAMQISILITATLFWHRVQHAQRTVAIAGLLGAMVAMGALGAIITLASQPLYAPHFSTTIGWGLSPLDDQQLAGLVMWAPASAVYLFAALVRVHRLVGREAAA
ncbi:cytochrome c oxidase assembly protein [Sphingomonas xanthus]|uniref:cytochrome c oxidase assembly protein n=1 Tax=Sphingomonas xanthus TaxID=2594473 RepID=UPI00164DF736|nr:cytochrome c oxidase assembly protein [Sphingomonas xanthus]